MSEGFCNPDVFVCHCGRILVFAFVFITVDLCNNSVAVSKIVFLTHNFDGFV